MSHKTLCVYKPCSSTLHPLPIDLSPPPPPPPPPQSAKLHKITKLNFGGYLTP